MTTEKRKRRNYTEDFERDAVTLMAERGDKIPEAIQSLGINDWHPVDPKGGVVVDHYRGGVKTRCCPQRGRKHGCLEGGR